MKIKTKFKTRAEAVEYLKARNWENQTTVPGNYMTSCTMPGQFRQVFKSGNCWEIYRGMAQSGDFQDVANRVEGI